MKHLTTWKPSTNLWQTSRTFDAHRTQHSCIHDLECIGDYIAQDSPQHAKNFVKKLRDQCSKVAETPLAFRLRTELGANIRSSAYGNYVIFFCADDNMLRILRVLHGSMDIEAKFAEGKQ